MNLSFTTLFAALVVFQNPVPIRMQETRLGPTPATRIPLHKSSWAVAVSPDGKSIACATHGGPLVVSFPDGKVLFKPEQGRKERTGYVAFTPDGKRLIGAFPGLQVWDMKTGQRLVSESWAWERQGPKEPPFRFPENEEFPIHPALSPDGKWLYVCGTNNDFRVIDVGTGKEVRGIRRRYLDPNSFAPSPDGKILAVTSPDSLFLFDTRTWTEEKVIDLPNLTSRFCVRFPIDSEQLFVLGPSGPRGKPEMRIWDRKKGDFTLELPSLDTRYQPQFAAVTVIGDGRYAVIVPGSGEMIETYDLQEKRYVGWTWCKERGVSSLILTPDGKHLIGGARSGNIVVIKVEDVLKTIAAGPQPVVKKKP